MKQAKDLMNAIKTLAGGSDMVLATVVSVDKALGCCDIDVDEIEFGNVRLQAIIKADTKGCKTFPAVGSKVVIEQMNNKGDWMVSLYSEVEEVLNEIGTSIFKMNAEGFVVKKGEDNLRNVIDDFMGQVKALNSQVQSIVVSPGYGVTPNVSALTAINNNIEAARTKAKNILK